jgi:diguanylate cyclase (GGDEF)-like protein
VSESIGLSVFESLCDPIAVLDHQGVVRSVNYAWRQFAFREDYQHATPSPIGLNYLAICTQSGGSPNGAEGPRAAEGIRAVIDGARPEFQLEYPCQFPGGPRWYRMAVTRLRGTPLHVLVRHINITDFKRAEIAANLARALLNHATEADPLTRLPSRVVLMQGLGESIGRRRAEPEFRYALLFLQLDQFSLVRGTLGPVAGDDLLVGVGRRLRNSLPKASQKRRTAGTMVARFGGDQFAYLACGIDGVAEAGVIADRLRSTLSAPHKIKGGELQLGVSIGIAMGEGDDPHELIRNAEIALNEAKRPGAGGTVNFDKTMHDRLSRRLAMEVALPLSLQRHELTLVYQPIVDLQSGRMLSAEALLRWDHPQLGAVSPDEFIPIAEDSDLIVTIGEWQLRESCAQWARWRAQCPESAPATVSVNLSRAQLDMGADLLVMVQSALAAAEMPAEALQIEIAEREVMRDPVRVRELTLSLRNLGVRLAMDDFGTAMSSLASLREYPFHGIKIGKPFLTDIGHDPHVLAVAHATINVIESLGMTSIAEGIEDLSVLAVLQNMGCRCGQGHLFSHPVPAGELIEAMRGRPKEAPSYTSTGEPI